MTSRALGLGPALRQAAFAPRVGGYCQLLLQGGIPVGEGLTSCYLDSATQRCPPQRYWKEVRGRHRYQLREHDIDIWPRTIKTNSLTPQAGDAILNEQRLKRPSSPHFTIYQPQLTWVGSIFNRMTGAALSVCA